MFVYGTSSGSGRISHCVVISLLAVHLKGACAEMLRNCPLLLQKSQGFKLLWTWCNFLRWHPMSRLCWCLELDIWQSSNLAHAANAVLGKYTAKYSSAATGSNLYFYLDKSVPRYINKRHKCYSMLPEQASQKIRCVKYAWFVILCKVMLHWHKKERRVNDFCKLQPRSGEVAGQTISLTLQKWNMKVIYCRRFLQEQLSTENEMCNSICKHSVNLTSRDAKFPVRRITGSAEKSLKFRTYFFNAVNLLPIVLRIEPAEALACICEQRLNFLML